MTFQRTARDHRALGTTHLATRDVAGVRKARRRPAPTRPALPHPTPHLTPGQYVRLLASIDEAGGVVTIDEVSRAFPQVSQPIGAIFDLCDAGILNVDWESAFGGDMHVWRLDR